MFSVLTTSQLNKKINFIEKYTGDSTASDGSSFDSNANVSSKNIATLEAELNKDVNIQINRTLVYSYIEKNFNKDLADQYLQDIKDHLIYVHDETSLKPYCVSITMYPFLLDGLTKLGGESKAPNNIYSFCGSFINLVFAISSQFAGAVATVEFLLYFDYFAKKEFGDRYYNTHKHQVEQLFQQIVYTINQPAAARGYQSVFWNISMYDEPYFDSLFGTFMFPDMTTPSYDSVKNLQELFLSWINKERTKAILTFPVMTCAMLIKDGVPVDAEFEGMLAKQLEEKNSFFIYQSESADSLASCCRLRNEMADNAFSYSLGAGGVSTGSLNVITMNMNRVEQTGVDLSELVSRIHKYQVSYKKLMEYFQSNKMLTVYDAGFISMDKQYLTIGINGMAEAAEFNNIKADNNEEYKQFVSSKLKVIFELNKLAKKEYNCMFNTEFVPAENLGVKNSEWDKKSGLVVPRECYNSYFYIVEDENTNIVDKFILHGRETTQFLDGGSALHLNLDEHLSKQDYINIIRLSAKTGCNYFCINVRLTVCNDCGNIDKNTTFNCSKCSSENIDYATRIIGYLKRVSSWSTKRRNEHKMRFYHKRST